MGIQSITSHPLKLFLSFKVSDSNKTCGCRQAAATSGESSTNSIVLGSLCARARQTRLLKNVYGCLKKEIIKYFKGQTHHGSKDMSTFVPDRKQTLKCTNY